MISSFEPVVDENSWIIELINVKVQMYHTLIVQNVET